MPDDFPTAHDSEKCLLSCVMRGGGGVRERAVDRMRPNMFDKHETLAQTVLRIARDGRPDEDTVKAEHDRPEEVDDILEHRPAPQNVDQHMRAVQESWGKLRLIQAAFDAVEKAKGDHTFTEASTSLEEDVIELTQKAGGSERTDSSDVLREVLSDLEDEQGQLVTGIPTPFPAINKLTRGLQSAELTIPFGSTSMGKTAWGLTVCLHAAKEGHPVAIHTLEMSEKALHRRLLQMIAGVDLRQTTIPDSGWAQVTEAAGKLDDLPIYIVDTPGLDYLSHRSSLRRLQYEHDIELAFLDYLQIMGAPASEDYSSGDSCLGEGLSIVAKQRNGPTGDARLAWVEEQVRWQPLDKRDDPAQATARGDGAPASEDDAPF